MEYIKQAVIYADSSRGIYIPQHFAETYNEESWIHIDQEAINILLIGLDDESYWDAWQDILDNAETTCGGYLHQDGDLWIVWPQLAINAVNECCQSMLEYEESHQDSGDNYAHMIAESWSASQENILMAQLTGPDVLFEDGRCLPEWNIDPMGLDPDVIADLALDLFTMQSGSIHGPYGESCIVLDSFGIQEIEIDLSSLGIDGITMELIEDSCDAYISGTSLAYMTTDAVWYAVVNPNDLQQAIIERKEAE